MTTSSAEAPATADAPGPDGDPDQTARRLGTQLPHVEALDGLRGAAVAAVLFHHAGHLTGGWLGVDLFFVLSGYLITALLLQGWKDRGSVALGNFWARRVRRLGPALVLLLLGVSAYALLVATPTELLTIRNDGLATLFEVANLRTIATGGDYWATLLRPSPLRHTWSLAIEEQLYLFWPLVVAGVLRWRRTPRAVLVVSVIGAVVSAALMEALFAAGISRSRLYYGTDTRAAAVFLGAVLASARVTMGPRRWAATRPLRHAAGVVGAIALAVAWWGLDGSSGLAYQVLPLLGVAGALVVASIADRRHPGPVGRVLNLPPLPALGRISYGVYLYHWPIFLVVDGERTGLDGWVLTAARIAVTVAVAAASYRFVEEPIRMRRRLTGRQGRAAVPACAAIVIIALVASTLNASSDDLDGPPGFMDRSSVPGAPTIVLAGDSVPLLLGAELARQKDDLGVSVVNRSAPGCHLLASIGPIRGTEGDVRDDTTDCASDGFYRKVANDFRPDASVVFFGEFPNQAVEIEGRWRMPCNEVYLQAIRLQLDDLVADLQSQGAPVVLLTAPGTSLPWVLERVEPGMPERVACSNELLYDLAEDTPGVTVIDLASYICPPGEPCKDEIDGSNLREDGLHFKGAGARAVNNWLIPQVQAIAEAAKGQRQPGGS
ncbi:acyltransferase family protein [Aquihabitans daechungensis]|uniref:acyltransferase family protein n=1 Tax=Aquihabitans daechungensis TaxID=1052257 RepID=UPI003B9EB7D9